MLKKFLWLSAATLVAIQWIFLRIAGAEFSILLAMLLSGIAIFGGAFLFSWSAELLQLEVPQSLAIAVVAFLAVFPEYAVDVYFAWSAGQDLSYAPYATANMTGANRLLIGIGWAAVVFVAWLKCGKKEIQLEPFRNIELRALIFATAYSFILPLKGTISLVDSLFLALIFGFYIRSVSKLSVVKPDLEEGPPELINRLPRMWRNIAVSAMLLLGGASIFLAAEPFAESILMAAKGFGIEEFLLVQWLAPLASEAPEFVVAILFAWRANAGAGMGMLISSKVNQWTLLIAAIPVFFAVSSVSAGGTVSGLPLDARQSEELALTAAQSLFAIVVLVNLSFSLWEAGLIFVLFATQLVFPEVRHGYAFLYAALAVFWLTFFKDNRRAFFALFKKHPR